MSQQKDQSPAQPSSQEYCAECNELDNQELSNVVGGSTPVSLTNPEIRGAASFNTAKRIGPTHWADPNELAARLRPIAQGQDQGHRWSSNKVGIGVAALTMTTGGIAYTINATTKKN